MLVLPENKPGRTNAVSELNGSAQTAVVLTRASDPEGPNVCCWHSTDLLDVRAMSVVAGSSDIQRTAPKGSN
jgi:hypothetical protein